MTDINIHSLIDEFIRTHPKYKSDVKHFISFLTNSPRYTLTKENAVTVFSGLRADAVVKCLEENNTFRTKSKAYFFVNVVSGLFVYLLANGLEAPLLKTDIQDNTAGQSVYWKKTNEYIESHYDEKTSFVPLGEDVAKELITVCDRYIADCIDSKKTTELKLKQMSASICIKLMLYTGITYDTAKLLMYDSFGKPRYGLMQINNVPIVLPPKLGQQIYEYLHICKNLGYLFDNEHPTIFRKGNGSAWDDDTQNSGMTYIISKVVGRTSTAEISRYAIFAHIQNNMPELYIKQLAGIKSKNATGLDVCYQLLEKEKHDVFSIVNSSLVKHPLFLEM